MKHSAAVGIDVGGTKTLCVLVDKECELLEEIKFKTAPEDGRDSFTENLANALRQLEKKSKDAKLDIIGVGVGWAGLVDHEKLRVVTSPNLKVLEDYPIGKHVREVLPVDVAIGNDVQMGIYAEHRMGAAKGVPNVLGVFFGTGVGGAVIINNRLHVGASGFGGQVGCLLAQPVGGPKAALSHGMLDRIASKAAIGGEALALAAKDAAPHLKEMVGSDLSKIGWHELKQAIEQGDDAIEELLRARLRVVGITLSNVVNFLNPEMLVLGGGLVDDMEQLVLQEVQEGLREYLTPEVNEALQVKPAKLNGAAVALGAAYKALKEADAA